MSDELGSVDSWECLIDDCLGQANKVLRQATDDFIAGLTVDAETVVALAEAWRDLAAHWSDRQMHELELSDAVEEYEPEEPETRKRSRAR